MYLIEDPGPSQLQLPSVHGRSLVTLQLSESPVLGALQSGHGQLIVLRWYLPGHPILCMRRAEKAGYVQVVLPKFDLRVENGFKAFMCGVL